MAKPMGSVIILMEPNAIAEDEFHDWYDHEHIPDRKKVAGCATVERFVCTDGWPRYLCLYDWDTLDVLHSDAYKAVHATANRSPWTSRILAHIRGYQRIEANQIHPGRARLGENGPPARVLMARLSNAVPNDEKALIDSHAKILDGAPGVLQWRLFRTEGGPKNEYWLCVEFRAVAHVDIAGVVPASGAFDIVNIYSPYWRNP